MAHAAGLTVFALGMTDALTQEQAEGLAARLGGAGADRVLVCEGPGLGAPPLDATHGRALLTAAERIPPIVVLFPAGGPGDELGPPLASRLGAAFGRAVDVEISDEPAALADGVGRVRFCRWRADRSGLRCLDPVEIERPVVAILGAHGLPVEVGTADVDVEVIACPSPAARPVVELSSEPDERAALALARGLVLVGAASDADRTERLRAALPADIAVVQPSSLPPGALASSSPQFVLDLDLGADELPGAALTSPRTRVGRVESAAAPGVARSAPDFVWRPAPAAAPAQQDPWAEIAAALAAGPRPGGAE